MSINKQIKFNDIYIYTRKAFPAFIYFCKGQREQEKSRAESAVASPTTTARPETELIGGASNALVPTPLCVKPFTGGLFRNPGELCWGFVSGFPPSQSRPMTYIYTEKLQFDERDDDTFI